MNVSKLTKVKIKDIWKTEDRDFTPWLVENITRLNEDIGFNIQDPQKENRLENFIVDIVAEDDEGKVIIENQYNKSDHDHLGKLLTYLSNVQGTKKAIWIVEEARAGN
jgi:RecB family endonuclease NucS